MSVAPLLQQHHQQIQQMQEQEQHMQKQQHMQQQQIQEQEQAEEQELEVFVPPKQLNVPAGMELVSTQKLEIKTIVLLCLSYFPMQILRQLL